MFFLFVETKVNKKQFPLKNNELIPQITVLKFVDEMNYKWIKKR